MSHPATYYIRFLIYSEIQVAEIYSRLLALSIHAPGQDVLTAIAGGMGRIVGTPQEVCDGAYGPTQYAKRIGILNFILSSTDADAVIEGILKKPLIRQRVECALLARIDYDEIPASIKDIEGADAISAHHLRLYKHYFWNVDLLSTQQMIRFLQSTGDPWYVEALEGGRDHFLYRNGKKEIDVDPDLTHRQIMSDMAARAAFINRLPYNEGTDMRATLVARTYSSMWKNSKSVGGEDLRKALDDLKGVVEKRKNAEKEMGREKRKAEEGEEDNADSDYDDE